MLARSGLPFPSFLLFVTAAFMGGCGGSDGTPDAALDAGRFDLATGGAVDGSTDAPSDSVATDGLVPAEVGMEAGRAMDASPPDARPSADLATADGGGGGSIDVANRDVAVADRPISDVRDVSQVIDGPVDVPKRDAGLGATSEAGSAPRCPVGGDVIDAAETCSDSFTITLTVTSGPAAQQVYLHTYNVMWSGSAFSGTGTSSEGATKFEQTICGAVSGGRLEYHAVYTTVVPGYTIDGVATVAADGTASGTGKGVDPRGASQTFTLTTTKVKVACSP